MKNWKQILVKTSSLCCLALLSSCGIFTHVYECKVTAKGSQPSNMTYYVVPADSTHLPTPEFLDYSDCLKRYLNQKNYVESDAANAALRIEFEYTFGNPKVRKTTVATTGYVAPGAAVTPVVNTQTSANSVNVKSKGVTINIDNPEGAITALKLKQLENKSGIKNDSKKDDKKATPLMPPPTQTTYVTEESNIVPLRVVIRALDNNTRKLVWRVVAKDELEDDDDPDLVMPWLLVCAVDYVGENTNGESTVSLKDKSSTRATYGLVWPY
jgi:hypothetical protein